MCLKYCLEKSAAFMAVQWGFECWCSDDSDLEYDRHYEAAGVDAVCDMECFGEEVRTVASLFQFAM